MPNNINKNSNQLPYNPNDVDIRQQSFTIDMIVNMIEKGEIELWRPDDFQRLSGLWTVKQNSWLIESLLMNIPLPIFYMDGSEHPWKIIDGLQRLTVIHEFINKNSFALLDLQYEFDLEGRYFHQLPYFYQRTIRNFYIQAYIINPGTPREVVRNIFQRINTAGIRLNKQELRNAYFSGKASSFIVDLTEIENFQQLIGKKISNKRMKDRVYALRFVAFYMIKHAYEDTMDKFLDLAMEDIQSYNNHILDDIKTQFDNSLQTCLTIFEDDAFYILNKNGKKIDNKLNISLFETWTVNLAYRNQDEHRALIANADLLISRYIEYFTIPEFNKAITSSTTSKSSVDLRFAMISDLIDISI